MPGPKNPEISPRSASLALSFSKMSPVASRGRYAGQARLKKMLALPMPICSAMRSGSVRRFSA
jgi:hypothetical protein